MKLYLTSYRIPTPDTLRSMIDVDNPSLGIIVNAKDYKASEDREFKLNQLEADLSNLGFEHTSRINLLEYKESPADVRSEIFSYDAIYVCGGSTPALRIAMIESGFDQIIREYVESGRVYIGESAGAYVAGPTIKVAEESDRHAGIPYFPEEGLSLIHKSVIPHADNPDYADGVQSMAEQLQDEGYEIIMLNDNQAVVVNDDSLAIETGDNSAYENRPRS